MFDRKEYYKGYRKTNKEKINTRQRQYYKNNDKKVKEYNLKRLYNLSHDDWLRLWKSQDGKCAICGKSFRNPSNAYVDHNHKTEKIRGLLCLQCNSGIGFFNDDPGLMAGAIKYLFLE